MSELVVVAFERQVEIVSREGARAETRRRLGERLATALLQNTRFANAAVARAALAAVLAHAVEGDDAPVSRSASKLQGSAAAWERLVDTIDDAIGVVRAASVDARALGAIEDDEPTARLLRRAMNALDARLERHGLVDERLKWEKLGGAITRAPADVIARIVSSTHVRARFVFHWSAADAAWWKPMSVALSRVGGGASVELPVIEKPIDAMRASDPFEAIVSDIARLLDEAPVEVECATPFGDLAFVAPVPAMARGRVELRRALDAEAQARAVAHVVANAIDEGAATDRIAIGLPRGTSDRAKRALATQFEDMDVPLHIADDEESALLRVAFDLLEVGTAGLPRMKVAALLRSRVLDAEAIAGVADGRVARRALRDLARALEGTPTVEGDEPIERLVHTARVRDAADAAKNDPRGTQRAELAARIGRLLLSGPTAGDAGGAREACARPLRPSGSRRARKRRGPRRLRARRPAQWGSCARSATRTRVTRARSKRSLRPSRSSSARATHSVTMSSARERRLRTSLLVRSARAALLARRARGRCVRWVSPSSRANHSSSSS